MPATLPAPPRPSRATLGTFDRIHGRKLSMCLSLRLEHDPATTSIRVIVCAPVHVRKEWEMPHCYSDQFTVEQILGDRDLLRVMSSRYGDDFLASP